MVFPLTAQVFPVPFWCIYVRLYHISYLVSGAVFSFWLFSHRSSRSSYLFLLLVMGMRNRRRIEGGGVCGIGEDRGCQGKEESELMQYLQFMRTRK